VAGGLVSWVWCSGEGWMFICSEFQFDKVTCTYRGRQNNLIKHDTVAALVTCCKPAI
jgi:hypothetical protein